MLWEAVHLRLKELSVCTVVQAGLARLVTRAGKMGGVLEGE